MHGILLICVKGHMSPSR